GGRLHGRRLRERPLLRLGERRVRVELLYGHHRLPQQRLRHPREVLPHRRRLRPGRVLRDRAGRGGRRGGRRGRPRGGRGGGGGGPGGGGGGGRGRVPRAAPAGRQVPAAALGVPR